MSLSSAVILIPKVSLSVTFIELGTFIILGGKLSERKVRKKLKMNKKNPPMRSTALKHKYLRQNVVKVYLKKSKECQ